MVGHDITKGGCSFFSPYRYRGQLYSIIYGQAIPSVIGQKSVALTIRYRLRMCIWKQWKTPQNRIKNLMKLGVDKDTAWITAYTGSRIAYVCQRRVMNFAINKERLTRFGLVSMLDYYTERCVTC